MDRNRCVGILKRVDLNTNNFGFLQQFHVNEDIFIHKKRLSPGMALTVGNAYEYETAYDDFLQKYYAVNITVPVQKTGTVVKYDEKLRNGFILSDPVGEEDPEKFYVKITETNGSKLVIGEKVVFYSTYDGPDRSRKAVIVKGPGGAVVGLDGSEANSECHKCGEIGHRANTCINPGANPTGKVSAIGCWRCGQDTHFSRQCPGNN